MSDMMEQAKYEMALHRRGCVGFAELEVHFCPSCDCERTHLRISQHAFECRVCNEITERRDER